MIIEIGTSDFRTEAGKQEGIFIEPITYYYDRLPQCNKENVAISNYTGVTTIHYIPEQTIIDNNLPNWLRGCNSIDKPHPTIVNNNWIKYTVQDIVPVVRIKSIIDKYNISHIHTLKIDTEGHDTIILNDYLNTVDIKPLNILFESNVLNSKEDVLNVIKRLNKVGYRCVDNGVDVECKLV